MPCLASGNQHQQQQPNKTAAPSVLFLVSQPVEELPDF
jgi:hypothetical protein